MITVLKYLFPDFKAVIVSLMISFVLSVGVGMYQYSSGYAAGTKAALTDQLIQVTKAEAKHDRKVKEVMSLDDIELRKRYCQWVRDDKAKCLQANIPIGE